MSGNEAVDRLMENAIVVSVETKAYGQPRPYADHRFLYRLTFYKKVKGSLEPFTPTAQYAERWAKAVHPWAEDAKWFEDRLEYLSPLCSHVWELKLTRSFTD